MFFCISSVSDVSLFLSYTGSGGLLFLTRVPYLYYIIEHGTKPKIQNTPLKRP